MYVCMYVCLLSTPFSLAPLAMARFFDSAFLADCEFSPSQQTSPSQADFQDRSYSGWIAGRPKAARWTDYPEWDEEELLEQEGIRKSKEAGAKASADAEEEAAEEVQELPKKKRQRAKKGRRDAAEEKELPKEDMANASAEAEEEAAEEVQELPKNDREVYNVGIFRAGLLPLGPFDFVPLGLPHSPAVFRSPANFLSGFLLFLLVLTRCMPVWLAQNLLLTRSCSGDFSAQLSSLTCF